MRRCFFILAVLSLSAIGCSHNQTKSDASAATGNSTNVKAAPVAASLTNASKDSEAENKTECTFKGEQRFIEIRRKDKGCELAYTKAGKENIVASSTHGKNYCAKALDKLSGKLKDAGYACK